MEGEGASVGVHYLSSKVTSEDEDCVVRFTIEVVVHVRVSVWVCVSCNLGGGD